MGMSIDENYIYTPAEFCEMLQISYRTYQRLKSENNVPAFLNITSGKNKNSHHRYLGSEIKHWIVINSTKGATSK